MTLRQHPLALLRPALYQLGLHDTRKLREVCQGQITCVPSMMLMRQRPGTAKGVVFVKVADERGKANLVVYANVGARDRAALIEARLLIAEGQIDRTGEHAKVPVLHLIARKLTDRSDLLNGLGQVDDASAGWDRLLGRADEVRRPDPGSRRPDVKMPPSRDFR